MSKIYWPCATCVHENDCQLKKGCYQWKAWFRAAWRRIREKSQEEGRGQCQK